MRDLYNRKIDYMRISVTDRCNFRCRYCMPDGIRKVPMEKILTYEQITEICEAGISLGITKFKITGGEPLVRLGCPDLVGMIRGIPGAEQITMTTNGMLLAEMLPALMKNGLDAVNISLDTLKPEVFRYITGKNALPAVLAGIHAAADSGLKVKINAVLQQGVNDGEWEDLLLLSKDLPVDVRFIEMMPIGHGKGCPEVSNDMILGKIRQKYPGTAEDQSVHGNGPARYVRIPGFRGGAGFISAIHGQFCASCNRIQTEALSLLWGYRGPDGCVPHAGPGREGRTAHGKDRRCDPDETGVPLFCASSRCDRAGKYGTDRRIMDWKTT